ncbi:MAG: hypothetical protein AAB581_02380, partial [Patescibacteria group bacterium]
RNKGVFVLTHTSNPGADEFQNQQTWLTDDDQMSFFGGDNDEDQEREEWPSIMPLYQHVAYRISRHWNKHGNCAVAASAKHPDALKNVRRIVGNNMPILVLGVGEQGAEIKNAVGIGKDNDGRGMIINNGRGIIFASNGTDFAEAARHETIKLRDLINQHR